MNFMNLQTDFAFKRVFGNEQKPHIAMSFLNSVLDFPEGEKIVSLVFPDPHNKRDIKRDKLSIVDVKCTDQMGRKFIIEMQVEKEAAYAQRSQYYVAHSLIRQLEDGEKFDKLLPVLFVGVLNFNMIDSNDHPLNHYSIVNRRVLHGTETLINDGLLKLSGWTFIELKKFNKKLEACESLVDKWIYLLRYAEKLDQIPALLGANHEIHDALDLLNKAAMTRPELEIYSDSVNAWRIECDKLDTAEARGEQKATFAIAKKMLKTMTAEEVATILDLTVDQLEKL